MEENTDNLFEKSEGHRGVDRSQEKSNISWYLRRLCRTLSERKKKKIIVNIGCLNSIKEVEWTPGTLANEVLLKKALSIQYWEEG